jgi:hypothetical protein
MAHLASKERSDVFNDYCTRSEFSHRLSDNLDQQVAGVPAPGVGVGPESS